MHHWYSTYLHWDLLGGEHTVLIRKSLTQVVKRCHALPENKEKTFLNQHILQTRTLVLISIISPPSVIFCVPVIQ